MDLKDIRKQFSCPQNMLRGERRNLRLGYKAQERRMRQLKSIQWHVLRRQEYKLIRYKKQSKECVLLPEVGKKGNFAVCTNATGLLLDIMFLEVKQCYCLTFDHNINYEYPRIPSFRTQE